ncbi:FHA domain-containing protein [Anaeromyxobacter oryzisoli]|uniref:FHA domain-containing protein n=1 Tax=Anaeromyxobacter oryzisoli TaxID=2925408 RepID=UPI001F56ED29|nr:FHA domain-containing protein [Anaeromyxobacter sp. SG63]
MKCKACGAGLDLTMGSCPACGVEVEFGRLTGILGIVCRSCDAYNDPGATRCAGCGKPLGGAEEADASSPAAPLASVAEDAEDAGTRSGGDAAAARGVDVRPGAASAAEVAKPPPDGPVIRSFQGAGAPAATRLVSAAAPRSPEHSTPEPLTARCPRCGAAAGEGPFCATCGQAIGARTQPAGPVTSSLEALAPGRVTLVLEHGGAPRTFQLDAEVVEAGRGGSAVAFPDDPCLAPHHATFLFRDGALLVRDEGAIGGTFLRLRGPASPLHPGDDFAVGERLLRYVGPLAPASAPSPDGTRRLGAPRPPGTAIVVEERLEGGAPGRVHVRGGPSITIGRAGCAVNLGDDPLISQAHAELVVEAGGVRLRDLGSASGTFVRLPPRGERALHDGDAVRLGREVLRVVAQDPKRPPEP